MDKLEYIKIKNSCQSKNAIKRVKGDRVEENVKKKMYIYQRVKSKLYEKNVKSL